MDNVCDSWRLSDLEIRVIREIHGQIIKSQPYYNWRHEIYEDIWF